MGKKIMWCCVVLAAFQISHAQETTMREDIRMFLELTGSADLGIQVARQMMSSYHQIYPDVPAVFWDEFIESIRPEDLTNLVIPIYEKHFTQDEIRELIAFYRSPIGTKMISVLPQLTQESMQAGQEWGTKIGEDLLQRLEQEGY